MTHVALLRAVNVGGTAVVRMTEVRAAFEGAGCRDVTTIGHAGNVLFTPGSRSDAAQQKKVRTAMQALIGTKVDICFRRLDDIIGLVARRPFGDLVSDESLKLYVAFMDREPTPRPRCPVQIPREASEIVGVRGAEMFIVSRRKPNGMYGFPTLFVEKLGVTATSRNWNTVVKLAAFARENP